MRQSVPSSGTVGGCGKRWACGAPERQATTSSVDVRRSAPARRFWGTVASSGCALGRRDVPVSSEWFDELKAARLWRGTGVFSSAHHRSNERGSKPWRELRRRIAAVPPHLLL